MEMKNKIGLRSATEMKQTNQRKTTNIKEKFSFRLRFRSLWMNLGGLFPLIDCPDSRMYSLFNDTPSNESGSYHENLFNQYPAYHEMHSTNTFCGIRPGIETQDTRHQKFKAGVSVETNVL